MDFPSLTPWLGLPDPSPFPNERREPEDQAGRAASAALGALAVLLALLMALGAWLLGGGLVLYPPL
jgi:hypothetical protein